MGKVAKQFVVTLKRVTYADVKIAATSAAEARRIVGANVDDRYLDSHSFFEDETTIVKIKPLA